MKRRAIAKFVTVALTLSMSLSILANTPPEALPAPTLEIYTDLLESSVTFGAREVKPEGAATAITYGAEKEGSSSLITRVMGPSGEYFSTYAKAQNIEFLRNFMNDYTSGRARERVVADMNGIDKQLTAEQLRTLRADYSTMEPAEVIRRFELFIQYTNGKPFSYLVPAYRQKIFNGKIPGTTAKLTADRYHYSQWVAHFGLSEKYIANAHGTGKGWEMNFNPMPTYGEFEEMIKWFKTELKNVGQLFEAPGHQRIVYPQPSGTEEQKLEYKHRMSEVYRLVQAYIIARGISGNTGIENANHKNVLADGYLDLGNESSSGRGVIRLDTPNRFVPNTYSIELRAGTKDAAVQQFIEQVITSHAAAGEFSGMAKIGDYKLFYSPDASAGADFYEIQKRFGISAEDMTKFYEKSSTAVKNGYQISLWRWENAPYMQGKKSTLDWATRKYIETVLKSTNAQQIKSALQEWIRTVGLETTLEHAAAPKVHRDALKNAAIYPRTGAVDVNRIDLGIEYSARFQNKFTGEFSPEVLADGQHAWLQTVSDMTPFERKQALRKVAADLGRELNGRSVEVIDVSKGDGHGHGLSVSFQVKDKQNRSWRIEWDGVGRTYTEDGKVVPESLRGGHIEIVTPKSVPSYEVMEALYTVMAKNSIIPSHLAGGGHINIDLAPFEGNPRALARFLSLLHANRGMIAYLFQNMNRNSVAEALEIRPEFARELADFRGTETELKRKLYNERYFNQRMGRKTRNVQIDMASYFQDVIPAEHIHTDFDMKNPNEAWRPQFRVEPHIRKMEVRLFDAPIDAYESSMQVKLVRALLHNALNETAAVPSRVQEVNHEGYARDYNKAKADFDRMCTELGLNPKEYKIFLARATVQGRQTLSSPHYQTYQQKIAERGWNKIASTVWGQAIPVARTKEEALSSGARRWSGNELPEATRFRQQRVEAARRGAVLREQHVPQEEVRREIKMGVNCRSVFSM